MESFKINEDVSVVCEAAKTRNGFKHTATLLRNGIKQDSVKICYLNRTWERYTYELVLYKLMEQSKKLLTPQEIVDFKTAIVNGGEHDKSMLKTVAMVAALGDVFGKTTKDKNDWKARMLKAGLGNSGLIMPDDWDKLDEATKEARLNGALAQLNKNIDVSHTIKRAREDVQPYGGSGDIFRN